MKLTSFILIVTLLFGCQESDTLDRAEVEAKEPLLVQEIDLGFDQFPTGIRLTKVQMVREGRHTESGVIRRKYNGFDRAG